MHFAETPPFPKLAHAPHTTNAVTPDASQSVIPEASNSVISLQHKTLSSRKLGERVAQATLLRALLSGTQGHRSGASTATLGPGQQAALPKCFAFGRV